MVFVSNKTQQLPIPGSTFETGEMPQQKLY
jgi:hypothetical protein